MPSFAPNGRYFLRRRDGSYRLRRRTIVIAALVATAIVCFVNIFGAVFGLINQNFGNYRNVINAEEIDEVVYFDEFVMRNVKATLQSAHSHVEWHPSSLVNVKMADDLNQFQTAPLLATVDRRPLTAQKQIMANELHNDGKILGCAMVGTTFLSDLADVYRRFEELPVHCDLCIQFSSRQDIKNFVPGVGYEPVGKSQTSTATKCFSGNAQLRARFPNWQREDARFKDFGYPWTVDCTLPNGIKELTCEEITKFQDNPRNVDSVQKIYFQTKVSLDGFFSTGSPKTFTVVTRWPWDALRSHDDDRSNFATSLPEAWNDKTSAFVPSSPNELKLAHVEGPGYTKTEMEGSLALESMKQNPNSYGGVHRRLIANLFHLIRNAPNSTHIMAVVDGQAHRSYQKITSVINQKVTELYPKYGKTILNDYNLLKKKEYVPITMMDHKLGGGHKSLDMTLKDLLRLRGIKIHIVPLATPSIAFEKSVCGIQYAFTSYLAARFAADYHVMMYIDGDTAMLEKSKTMQNIYFDRFFSEKSNKCVGHRFRLFEQYVRPEDDNIDRVLQCTKELITDPKKWNYVSKNCHLKEGHVVARTDSIHEFNVHHPDTIEEYLPIGLKDCITPGNRETDEYFLTSNEIVQIHLRDRERKPECTCFAEVPMEEDTAQ